MLNNKTIQHLCLGLLAGTLALTSCKSESESNQAELLEKTEGVVRVESGIGEWDNAYLNKTGYYCFSKNMRRGASEDDSYATVTYMSARDNSQTATLIAAEKGAMPTQLVTSKGTVYFSFPNDTILELVFDDGKTVQMLDSIPYERSEMSMGSDAFKSILANAAKLMRRSKAGNSIVNTYASLFENTASEAGSYAKNEELLEQLDKTEKNSYRFAETTGNWYDSNITAQSELMLWTGNATYKVGGSSCTLSATIWCPMADFDNCGSYGIVCDADPGKLTLEQAEYVGEGHQRGDALSFSVDFRGLKPNTTYYYRAYYKVIDDTPGLLLKHANVGERIVYDTTIKRFTTGDNVLTVDVVMCIDVTGSMSDIISTVKKNAIAFYDLFKNCCTDEGIELRDLTTQVIGYRDKNVDGSKWLQTSETFLLPDQRTEFNSFVNGLYADGGGDTPESGLEALEKAFSKSDWGVDDGYHRQVIILWTDAPYLVGSYYTSLTVDILAEQWNAMPSGRRLILFAPNGTSDSNSGSWSALDGWKNVIHETNLNKGFNDFEYILKSIIGELTSKGHSSAPRVSYPAENPATFRPN
ncbi:MAG: hypothetical protein IKR25_00675 [Muribaculaceae bacterium]|nr:hypothetical protein [Muribaculaceae bacterium]